MLAALKRDGSLDAVADSLAGFAERQQAVSKPKFDALEERYNTGAFTKGRPSA